MSDAIPNWAQAMLETLVHRWADGPLAVWADRLPAQLAEGLSTQRYGDLPRWQAALDELPAVAVAHSALDQPTVSIQATSPLTPPLLSTLEKNLRQFHPWRKGPVDILGVTIDTEWRSDWKWDRVAPHLASLKGRRVLDVGCGNGYHCWRMRGAGAAEVIGIDPTPLFLLQFQALQRYVNDQQVQVLPVGIEGVPKKLRAFDTVFSMGILYHRRSPIEHLQALRECLRPDGQLVLETLVIEGDERACLVPQGRYARMGNVWFIPSSAMLQLWLRKLGFRDVRLVDETVTSTREQRSTDWMHFHSLSNFLDADDPTKTIEGYPGPRRAIVVADAP